MEFEHRVFPARAGAIWRAALAGLLLIAAAVRLRSEETIRSLTLEQALAMAEQRNPTLLAQAQAIQSAKAGETTAGLRPNPTLQNDTTSSTAGIYQEIEVGGKRGARLESSRMATSISTMDYADTWRTVALGVRQAFIGALLARANVALARENLTSFQKVVDLNRLRLEKGALSGSDFLKIELQTLQFQSDLEDATLALKTARASLRSLLGSAPLADNFEVEGDLAAAPFERTLAELEQVALARRPDLKSAETGIGKSDADVRLAEANRWPDPTIGVSYLHTGNEIGGPGWFQPFFPKGEPTNAMGLGVSFPVPVFNRNQGEIARTRSERLRADLLARAVTSQVIQDVETAYAAFESSRERVRLYEGAYLARAKESRDIAEFAFQKGAVSLLDLLDAERTYRATQLAYRQALAGYMTSLAQLEAAVGGALTP